MHACTQFCMQNFPANLQRVFTRDVNEARTLEAEAEARTLEAELRTLEAKVEAKAEFIQFWPSE